jgi:hypothetical protein
MNVEQDAGRFRFSRETPATRRFLWGVFLMVIGGALLLGQAGILDVPSIWRLWPVVFLVIATASLLEGKPGGAVMMGMIGLSFFAAEFRWMGLSYRSFWPLLVVAVGLGMVVGAISGEDAGCARPEA